MPIECAMLAAAPVPLSICPWCLAAPFSPFLRGEVQRPRRRFWLFGAVEVMRESWR